MVQVKTAAVALILVAPSLALPLQKLDARSQELDAREPIPDPKFRFSNIVRGVKKVTSNPTFRKAASVARYFIREDGTPELVIRDLDAREPIPEPDPKFRFSNIVRGVKKIASHPGVRKAASIASWFIREDGTSELSARELGDVLDAFQNVSERDLDDIEELATREPKWGFLRKISRVVKKVSRYIKPAISIAKNFIREEDDDIFARADIVDMLDLSERDLEMMEELAAREPKWGWLRKISHVVKPALSIAKNFIREEDGDLYAREELSDLLNLSERDLEEMEELAAREPKWGWLRKISHVVKPAISIAKNFIREEDNDIVTREDFVDMLNLSERDLEMMEELAAREPKWGWLRKISHVVKPAISIAKNFIREDAEIDDLLARDYDFDLLD